MSDCFEVALELVLSGELGDGALLVHGLPIGTGEENRGKRFWHAWVELTERATIPEGMGVPDRHREIVLESVIDRANGRDEHLPRGMYYNVGRLDGSLVWRYSAEEAARIAVVRGSYGPWVDGWEEMGL